MVRLAGIIDRTNAGQACIAPVPRELRPRPRPAMRTRTGLGRSAADQIEVARITPAGTVRTLLLRGRAEVEGSASNGLQGIMEH